MHSKIIHITVEGGVIQDVQVPKGVKVIVRDYDADGEASERLKRDDEGDAYTETIWE